MEDGRWKLESGSSGVVMVFFFVWGAGSVCEQCGRPFSSFPVSSQVVE
jgi:hypothetical protein